MITLYNHDSERYVLGALFQDHELVRQLPTFPADLMHDDAHAAILAAMQQVYAEKAPVEIPSVGRRLDEKGLLGFAGGAAYLLECVRYVPSTANAGHYLSEIKKLMECRRAYSLASAFCRQLTDGEELDACMDSLRSGLQCVSSGGGELIRMPEMVACLMDDVDRRMKGDVRMLKTGLPDLDAILYGIEPVNFMLIGARPGIGKSGMGMQIALNVADKGGNVVVLSREMSRIQYARRMVSNESGVNGVKMKTGKLTEGELSDITDAANDLCRLSIGFAFESSTVEQLRRICQREKDRDQLDLVIVDYLQILKTSAKADKRYEEVGRVSRELKEIALDLKVPVIAMAQVGRQTISAGTTRYATMPVLSDLRESGNLEQDADIIVFLHHPEHDADPSIPEYDLTSREAIEAIEGHDYMVVNVAKNREAACGAFGIDYDKAHQRFTCIAH